MIQRRRVKITTEQIIEMFNEVHSKYDYSLVEYRTMHHKVKIVCSVHGVFEQTPNAHIRQSQGCKACGIERQKNDQRDTTENFVRKAKEVHGDRYDYSMTEYLNTAHDKVKIICKEHGIFIQSPNSHLSKRSGCHECAKASSGWTRTAWTNACKSRKGSLYVIECFNETERFFKIGITSRATIEERFLNKTTMPYEYKVIRFDSFEDPLTSWELERQLHKVNREHKYKPEIFFDGFSECFSSYAEIH